MHWADEMAERLIAEDRPIVISTGITPSGPIHIGNLREVITADAVFRSLKEKKEDVTFYYVGDTFDPLRRVYPFLDQSYREHVGKPLSEIPCPCGQHPNYAEHFLDPFLKSLEQLDIGARPVRADQLYKAGKYVETIITSLEKRDQIAEIIDTETGKKTPRDWSPFNPLCDNCGRIDTTTVTGFDAGAETVDYACSCGSDGTVSMAGGGKLVWRVDWPARWKILGVAYEPFGKDHASRGGSYATGKRIAEEVFQIPVPNHVIYEWISLKGRGDMSSSKGNVITIEQMLEVVPPEVLRYFILRRPPRKSIAFDPGLPMLNLINEYDDVDQTNRDKRSYQLSIIRQKEPVGVAYKHLVSVVQIAGGDQEAVFKILKRSGYEPENRQGIIDRANYARRWLRQYAPEDVKFELQQQLPARVAELSDIQKKALAALADELKDGMSGEDIHQLFYRLSQSLGAEPQEIFKAIYIALLGKERGPRAGWFIAALDHDFVSGRFREAAAN